MGWRMHCGSVPQPIATQQSGEPAAKNLRRGVGDGASLALPLAEPGTKTRPACATYG